MNCSVMVHHKLLSKCFITVYHRRCMWRYIVYCNLIRRTFSIIIPFYWVGAQLKSDMIGAAYFCVVCCKSCKV